MAIDRYSYPFTAIVGQVDMKLALVLNAIHPAIGGVLIRGEKGTGKSTAVRALAHLLPDQQVVEGCHFGCHPDDPEDWCSDCRDRGASGGLSCSTALDCASTWKASATSTSGSPSSRSDPSGRTTLTSSFSSTRSLSRMFVRISRKRSRPFPRSSCRARSCG